MLVSCQSGPSWLSLHGHGGRHGHGRGGHLGRDLSQTVLLVLGATPSAQLTGGTAGVAAGQETKHTHPPEEPARGPAAPAQEHRAGRHTQNHIQGQQRHVLLRFWGNRRRVITLKHKIPNVHYNSLILTSPDFPFCTLILKLNAKKIFYLCFNDECFCIFHQLTDWYLFCDADLLHTLSR